MSKRIIHKSKVSIFKKPGRPHYYLYVPQEGRRWPKEMSSGTSSMVEAKKIASQVEADLIKKELHIPIGGSFASFTAKYLDYCDLNKSHATYVAERGILSSLMSFVKADNDSGDSFSISKIPTGIIEDYKKHLSKSSHKAATINKHLRHLKAIFQEAVKWGLIKNNPVKGVRKLREVDNVVRFLTIDEIKVLLKLIDDPDFLKLIKFYLLTGMRRNEALFLDWSDFKDTHIMIRNKEGFTTKTGKNRKLPISSKLHDLIQALDRSKERPFTYKPDWVSRKFASYSKIAGFKDVDIHCLRHTFASHLIMAGVDLVTIKELLGHASIQTTMIYAHLMPDHLKAAVEKTTYL